MRKPPNPSSAGPKYKNWSVGLGKLFPCALARVPPRPLESQSPFCAYSSSVALVFARLDSLAHTMGLGGVSASEVGCVRHAEDSSTYRAHQHANTPRFRGVGALAHGQATPTALHLLQITSLNGAAKANYRQRWVRRASCGTTVVVVAG